MNYTDCIKQNIEKFQVSQDSQEEYAEHHTPSELINQKLDKLPESGWNDPEKTWLDPACGVGNYPIHVVERLMDSLDWFESDLLERYKHIMENQIFMIEIQIENCIMIERLFNVTGDIKLNLKCCDALELDVENMEKEDWKTERFRTNYKKYVNPTFWEQGPAKGEVKKLKKVEELTFDPDILKHFRRGYEEVEPVF